MPSRRIKTDFASCDTIDNPEQALGVNTEHVGVVSGCCQPIWQTPWLQGRHLSVSTCLQHKFSPPCRARQSCVLADLNRRAESSSVGSGVPSPDCLGTACGSDHALSLVVAASLERPRVVDITTSPGSCRNVPRHAFPKVTRGDPGELRSCRRSCPPVVVRRLLLEPRGEPSSTRIADSGHRLAEIGRY